MSIMVYGNDLHINFTIPLPRKYRGGGVALFRFNNGQPEVLLGLRANNPGKGLWSFPGGEAVGKEKLSTAAIREFREETGVQLYGRYITRTGLFQIRIFCFEWSTLLIESTQEFNIGKRLIVQKEKTKDRPLEYLYGGEFISLQWVPLSEIKYFKLHRWVLDVINFYNSGKMAPYFADPPRGNIKILVEPKKTGKAKIIKRESGESLLFDKAEMVLTKVGRDGTKYFQPAYQIKSKHSVIMGALYGV